jgi:hypothetical protein
LEEKQFQKVEPSFSIKKETTGVCRVCQSSLEEGDEFCSVCGTAVAPRVSICRVCSTENSGDVCGRCGTPVRQITCQHCGKEAEGDFCASCGKAITDLGREFIENVNQAVEPKIIQIGGSQELKNSLLSELGEDFAQREERRIEKIVLLRERQFFQEREKRVEEFFKSGIVHFQRMEDKEILKIRERIEKSSGYLSRQLKEKEEREAEERRIAEEFRLAEEKRKEEERIAREKYEEQERVRKEEERVLQERILAEEKKREEARLAEEKRVQEELKLIADAKKREEEHKKREEEARRARDLAERKRQEELQAYQKQLEEIKRHLEEEARQEQKRQREAEENRRRERALEEKRREEARRERWRNRIDGIYYAQNYPGTFVIKIQDGMYGKTGKGMECDSNGKTFFDLNIKWNGEGISFFNYDIEIEYIRSGWTIRQLNFIGRASDDGEILRGYCYSAETWEEIFIKE